MVKYKFSELPSQNGVEYAADCDIKVNSHQTPLNHSTTEKNIRHLSLRPQPRNMSRNRYGHPEMHSPNAPHRSASA